MDKTTELLAKKADKVFHQLYEKIFSFLDFPSLMQALSVSQDFYHLLNKYFKSFLKTNNLIDDNEMPAEVDEHYYLKLFRAFYAREVLVAQLANVKESYSEIKLVRYPRCSTYGVKDFSIGTKFTVFQLYNNDIIFLKNEEYLNPLFNMKNINRKNIRKNITKFSTTSNDLFYLTSSGHLHVIFHSNERPSDELAEGILDVTIGKPIKDFSVAYPHAILFFKVPEISQKAHSEQEEQKEDKAKKGAVYQDIRSLELHNLIPEDFNSPARLKKVEGLDDQPIISFCVGAPNAYFLTDKNKVYECDLNMLNNDKYMIFLFEDMKNKVIRKLWSGKNFFFALEQNENPSIEHWSQAEILKWASTPDFSEFTNILRYENITGNDLLKADKAFLVDRLGMQREDLQIKFLNAIEKVSKKTYNKPRILGWGNNSYGQLGLNTGHVTVNHPSEVKQLPELEKGDQIEDIECGTKATAIITQKGKVWITEIIPSKRVAPPSLKEEEEASTSKSKKKKKESVDLPKEKEEKPFVRWLDLTPICEKLKDGRQYKIIKITLSKDYFAALGVNCGQKKKGKTGKKEEEVEESHAVKLKGADHICNRLVWDKSLNRDEFVVGYEDRFLGILEIPFNEFALKTDIPTHRIKFFKKKGEVVWDRTTKVNKI